MNNFTVLTRIFVLLIYLLCSHIVWGKELSDHSIILRFHDDVASTYAYAQKIKAKKISSIHLINTELWSVPSEVELPEKWLCSETEIIDYIANQYPVRWVEPDQRFSIDGFPTDSDFINQWPMHTMPFNGCEDSVYLGAVEAWKYSKGEGVVVGIIDTGIDSLHPDLWANQWVNPGEDLNGNGIIEPNEIDSIDNDNNGYIDDFYGWDFVNNDNHPWDDNGHGTHIAGIIAARDSNQIGVVGVAPRSKMMILKALDEHGIGSVFHLTQAIIYSIQQGIKITNNSWSRTGVYSQLIYDAIKVARDSGQLFVTAAGNNQNNNDIFPVYPANYDLDNIIVVGATDCHDQVPVFSNYGPNTVDIMAPGDGIYSTLPNHQYGFKSGTSMAAPFVAGAAALVWAQDETRTWQEIKGKILGTTGFTSALAGKCVTNGRLDLANTLKNESEKENGSEAILPYYGSGGVLDMTISGDKLFATVWGMGLIEYNLTDSTNILHNSLNSPISSNDIYEVAVDSNGNIWTGSNGDNSSNKLLQLNNNKWTSFVDSATQYLILLSIDIASNQDIWLGNRNGKLILYSHQNQWAIFDTTHGLPHAGIQTVEVIDSIVWVGSNEGLMKFNINKQAVVDTIDTSNSNLMNDNVRDTWSDGAGKVWIAHHYGGLSVLENDSIHNISGINATVSSISNDIYGNIWMNAFGSGIFKYDGNNAYLHNADSGLAEKTIYSVYADSIGRVWAGGNNGIYLYESGQGWKTVLDFSTQISSSLIFDMCLDLQGNLIAATFEGVIKRKEETWNFMNFNTSAGPIDNRIKAIATHPDGSFWGLAGHLFHLVGDSLSYYDNSILPSPLYPYDLVIKDSFTIWIATSGGLVEYSLIDSSFTLYDSTFFNGLNPNIYCFAYDSIRHTLWLGTNGTQEIIKVNTDSMLIDTVYFKVNAPLSFGAAREIVVDTLGTAWLSTGSGIISISEDTIQTFTTNDYGPGDSNFCSSTIDHKGNIWFGSWQGRLLKYNPTTQSWTNWTGDNSTLPPLGKPGISNSLVFECLMEDRDHHIWIGTNAEGLFELIPDAATSFGVNKFTLCLDDTLKLFNTTKEANSYLWLINDNIVSTDTHYQHVFTQPGKYKITLIAQDSLLGNRNFTQFIEVNGPISISIPDTTVCGGGVFFFPQIHAEKFLWRNSLGDTLGELRAFTANANGVYTIQVTDACGFVATDTFSVTLTSDPIGSCIWPGDVNQDGWVNILDFILLGSVHGLTGPSRPNASLNFHSQPAPDWDSTFTHKLAAGLNVKSADVNGDGVIDIYTDYFGILQNAQASYPSPKISSTDSIYRLRVKPQQKQIANGDTLILDIYLDDGQGGTIPDLYALVFSLQQNINPQGEVSTQLDSSVMGTPGIDLLALSLRYSRLIDVAITRTNQQPKNTKGKAGVTKRRMVVVDIDTSKQVKKLFYTINPTQGTMFTKDGTKLPLNTLGASMLETVVINLEWLELDINAFLQGPYQINIGDMHTTLRDSNWIPLLHSFPDVYQPRPDSIPPDVVDWLLVELRDKNDSTKIITQRAAWLRKDGQIIDPEGGNTLSVMVLPDDYYIVIKHRNHAPIMSANPISVLGNSTTTYDFTQSSASAFGSDPMLQLPSGKWAMYAGDINQDRHIIYQGPDNDIDPILNLIGPDKSHVLTGYHVEDVNLDGKVKYTGTKNDRAPILINIGVNDLNKMKSVAVPPGTKD
jgi:subtilisin family serine protease/ligand-binding sensor domain-containing protein